MNLKRLKYYILQDIMENVICAITIMFMFRYKIL